MRNVCPKIRKDFHQEVDVSNCTEGEGKGEKENDTGGRGEGRGRERFWGRGRGREKMILKTEGKEGQRLYLIGGEKILRTKPFQTLLDEKVG